MTSARPRRPAPRAVAVRVVAAVRAYKDTRAALADTEALLADPASDPELKTLAVALMKIANDLRWMNSGPNSGLAEIRLPALQAGSSIMPGKVNPVIPEAAAMVCARVIGNDATITIAGQSGNAGIAIPSGLIRLSSSFNGRGAPYTNYSFSFIDNLSVLRGNHNMKFGVEIRPLTLWNDQLGGTTYSFPNVTAFLANQPSSIAFNGDLSAQSPFTGLSGLAHLRQNYYILYAQDEFKVTPNLTLNFGLRYEFYSVVHEILDRSAVVDIRGCGGFCSKGTPYYDPNYHDFGPRAGLAWAPAIFHGKTTIRSGFGVYYGGNQNDDFSDPAESATPRYSLSSSDFPALAYPLVAFLDPRNQLYSPKAIDRRGLHWWNRRRAPGNPRHPMRVVSPHRSARPPRASDRASSRRYAGYFRAAFG